MNYLTSDDHLGVISSISILLVLYPRSIEIITIKKAIFHALSITKSNLLIKTSLLLLSDKYLIESITFEDLNLLIKLLINLNI